MTEPTAADRAVPLAPALPPALPPRSAPADRALPPDLPPDLPADPPLPPDPPVPTVVPAPVVNRLRFTGDGGEYFRIWITNLLLTLATLGIWSAWAKVRKTRYFWQNTQLGGHVFDYHGRPMAVLRGRVFALLLLIAYTIGTEFSSTGGAIAVLVLLLAGPWLFLRANQFRMRNSSWRGLRFDFTATPRMAYRALMPILLLWFSGTLAGLLTPDFAIVFGVLAAVTPFLMPWMHHRLKRFQHTHSAFGDARSSFVPTLGRFYGAYLKVGLLAILVAVPAGLLGAGLGYGLGELLRVTGLTDDQNALALIMGVAVMVVMYIGLWPWFATRIQQIVWGATTIGPASFHTHVLAWPLTRLVAKAAFLTLVTCGLYWPWAAIALARYRIECMEVRTTAPFDAIAAAIAAPAPDAAGDGAADVFGLDLGL